MTAIELIFPPRADEADRLCHGLVTLTQAISQIDASLAAHGFLGGEFGYGAHYENEVFSMRPYYWGDCDCGAEQRSETWFNANPHANGCYQSKLHAEEIAAGVHYTQECGLPWTKREAVKNRIYKRLCAEFGLSYPNGCAVHCSCGRDARAEQADIGHRSTCAVELPNFRFKPSGFEVRWYKWIGRGNETKGDAGDLALMFQQCIASLPALASSKETP